jgi:hypothetical protein
MIGACLAQHLGLSQAIAGVVFKIAKCSKCLSFWCVFFVLVMSKCSLVMALLLSVLMAYLSHYFNIVLMFLNNLYDWLWQKGNK